MELWEGADGPSVPGGGAPQAPWARHRAPLPGRPGDPGEPRGLSPAEKSRALDHYQRLGARYDALVARGLLAPLRARERQAVLRLAALQEPQRRTCLDVGCGGGFYARAAKRAGKWVHAVDAAPAMVEGVRAEVDLAEVADLDGLRPRAGLRPARGYDLVLCCGVLDFVSRPGLAVDALCRLCAPGGRLVLLAPRAGLGGLCYRAEKRAAGLSVVLYGRAWLEARARRNGLTLTGAEHPLPCNMALRFDRL